MNYSADDLEPETNGNFSGLQGQPAHALHTLTTVVTSLVLGVIILTTIIGNVFVIAAILRERGLQSAANYLIVSLALADLLVACLVMPLGAVYEIMDGWWLGTVICDMWTSADVLCCTASILHLLAIAMDRYWAVTDINYIQSRNPRRILTMISVVWLLAVVISVGPLLGWKDDNFEFRVLQERQCMVSQHVGYQIFATLSSFYVPLGALLSLYYRIFQEARRRIRHKPRGAVAVKKVKRFAETQEHTRTETTTTTNTTLGVGASEYELSSFQGMEDNSVYPGHGTNSADEERGASPRSPLAVADSAAGHSSSTAAAFQHLHPRVADVPASNKKRTRRRNKKESLEAKRERKAAKTLAIVTGAFIVCWLPFFVTALLLPLCSLCQMSDVMMSVFLWLGWFNSTLNPIIYTVFSPEFRQAFHRILCGRRRYAERLAVAR